MNTQALKLICALLYSCLVAFSSLEYYFLLPILSILFIEKRDFKKIIKRVFLLNFFIIFLVVFVYFQNEKEAVELFFRTNLIMLFNISIFYKSKGYDIVRALDSLSFPKKFVTLFYFAVVMIEFLFVEFKKNMQTLKLRGFYSKVSLFSYQTFGNIFAMMFIKAIKKSEDMRNSFILRGFLGEIFLLNDTNIKKEIVFVFVLVLSIVVLKVVNL